MPDLTAGRLPKATVAKAAADLSPCGWKVSSDACNLLVGCSAEFIQLLSSEANELAGNILGSQHIVQALQVTLVSRSWMVDGHPF
jgi:hypothetical protein|eukprot:SAG25_NODE_703_length_5866_cov_3.884169_1_plen_85_part_00